MPMRLDGEIADRIERLRTMVNPAHQRRALRHLPYTRAALLPESLQPFFDRGALQVRRERGAVLDSHDAARGQEGTHGMPCVADGLDAAVASIPFLDAIKRPGLPDIGRSR